MRKYLHRERPRVGRGGIWILGALLATLAGGCWTFGKSEYPESPLVAASGNATNLVVAVVGFEATIVDYQTYESYSMMYVPGERGRGRRHWHPGYYEMVPSTTVVPVARTTDSFRRRAEERFEDAGYSLASAALTPDFTVEVAFEGPTAEGREEGAVWGWRLCTVFFCDYATDTWLAKLRIRDNRTGKVLLTHTYSQRYETHAFGLVPIFSIMACEETDGSYIQGWCLSALTDRVSSDAMAFLANR